MEEMPASEFKAKCLGIIDRVRDTGEGVVILKRGRPVARLVPIGSGQDLFAQDTLKGTVEVVGDILEPVVDAQAWEALGGIFEP